MAGYLILNPELLLEEPDRLEQPFLELHFRLPAQECSSARDVEVALLRVIDWQRLSWEAFLANGHRLADNDTRSGARPPREGTALLQGIVLCGSCGRAMQVLYSSAGKAMYDCTHARADHTNTPGCRSMVAAIVDDAVAQRLLAVVTPPGIAVALAAAAEVMDRWTRSTRALELRVERARYEAARAERAFHHCEPENRLVARSLEHRWEEALQAVAEAEAALATAQAASIPLPPRAELEALATDLPSLWAANTTSHKDRKRLLRTLVGDVTLTSERASDQVRIGIHWRSGATESVIVRRPAPACVTRRTSAGAVDFVRRHRERRDEELAFDCWMRRTIPGVHFERYADDAIVHCGSERQARSVLEAIRGRFVQCGLELHPTKTRVVYCKDDDRPREYEHVAFDFLGYTFQPRRAKNRWGEILCQLPAGDERQGRQAGPANHPGMADGLHQEQPEPGGPGPTR